MVWVLKLFGRSEMAFRQTKKGGYPMSKNKESWLALFSLLIVCGVVGLLVLVLFGQLLFG